MIFGGATEDHRGSKTGCWVLPLWDLAALDA